MYGLLTSEACFFRVLRHTESVDRAPRPYLYTRMRLRLWLPKVRKVNQFKLATFSKSIILRRHVIRFEGLGGKYILRDNSFVFIICLRQIFLDTTQPIWEGHKKPGGPALNAPPRG